MQQRVLTLCLALLLCGLAASGLGYKNIPSAEAQGDFPDVCAESDSNLVWNCQFNEGMSHWSAFVEAGSNPAFGVESEFPACDSPKCPALRIQANDWFVGGVYQQIPNALPGATYWANVVWLVYHPAGALDGTVGRRIGIDPTGGTDPTSPAIVWSPEIWNKFDSCPYKICRELQVQVTAQNTTITVFVRVASTWKARRNEFSFVPARFFSEPESFWIDDVGLIPVGDVPFPSPTPQPEIPTDTPSPIVTAELPVPLEVAEAVPTSVVSKPTATSTLIPVQSPTPTFTLTRLPTITPTSTRTPTPTRVPRRSTPTPHPTATPTPQVFVFAGALPFLGGGILCLGGGVLALTVLGGLMWMGARRAGMDYAPASYLRSSRSRHVAPTELPSPTHWAHRRWSSGNEKRRDYDNDSLS